MDRNTAETSLSSAGGETRTRVRQLVTVFAPTKVMHPPLTLGATGVARFVLGRAPSGEGAVPLDETEASREHAALERDEEKDAWFLVDLGSRNGTFVDGQRASRVELRSGSVVRIGRTLFVFVDALLPARAPLGPETTALSGHGIQMHRLRGEIGLVAPRPIPVLILGETGVGKENVASEIHRQSGRKGPFVPVNCAAISSSLADSELFGHAAGAFTGATGKSDGLFVAADGGTLFLDEIGELPAALQPKLLRALASGEVRAVGRADTRRVDVRIVAATHRDVMGATASDAFRGDLYARLSAWTLHVPSLRERREDVLRLARVLLERHGHGVTLATSAAEALLLFDWPFNVRQLEHVLVAAAVRGEQEGRIRLDHLPGEIAGVVQSRARTNASLPPGAQATAAAVPLALRVPRDGTPTRDDLELVIAHFEGNLAQVADFFGKHRRQVYRWLDRYGIDAGAGREKDPPDEPG